ncbi:unnamed protein product [Microthlaspi erraticum]|uniref:Uncharacterized protein n=1 Tax=Microthlaspi erraticum TaxID=1685480 RepID=A0A6D2JN84_9BRAS|nr:unnamed protein product [Microthlaspi erraticum]
MEVMEIAGKDPLRAPISLALEIEVYANSIESVYRRLGRARLITGKREFRGHRGYKRNLRSFGAFWSIWDVGAWKDLGMDAAQLDTQRKKEEAILKTSSTTYSTTGRVPQLDRPSFNSIELEVKVYANSIESVYKRLGRARLQHGSFGAFWSIWDVRSMEGLGHGRSSTGHAKEEGGSHLEDQLDHLLDQPVEFLNSTGQASTRSS